MWDHSMVDRKETSHRGQGTSPGPERTETGATVGTETEAEAAGMAIGAAIFTPLSVNYY